MRIRASFEGWLLGHGLYPLPRSFAPLLLLAVLAASTGCVEYTTTLRSKHYDRVYRLTENAKAFGCYGPVAFTWRPNPKCLLELSRELANPPQFPIGTRVRVLVIKRNVNTWAGMDWEVALLRVGEEPKVVEVFAGWPQVLDLLEEVDKGTI